MKRVFALLAIATLSILSPTLAKSSKTSNYKLISTKATKETRELYQKLASLQGEKMLFGHHYSNVSGINFTDWGQKNRYSDMVSSVGDYPAVFGFDFGRGFSKQLPAVKRAAEMGGVITISDHMPNPIEGKSYNHIKGLNNSEIKSVLPGGEHHHKLLARLDSIASFASLAQIDGVRIPIIYRPWHEHTGGWFWWGSNSGTAQEYCDLWIFTIEYLQDKKGVDNFIYAFSPSYEGKEPSYTTRNPGAEYFDIAGLDFYSKSGSEVVARLLTAIETMIDYAAENNKVAALTEFGYRDGIENCPNPKWYSEEFLNPILASKKAKRIAYALTWSNRKDQYWIPLSNHPMYSDFKSLYASPYTIFLSEWVKIQKRNKRKY